MEEIGKLFLKHRITRDKGEALKLSHNFKDIFGENAFFDPQLTGINGHNHEMLRNLLKRKTLKDIMVEEEAYNKANPNMWSKDLFKGHDESIRPKDGLLTVYRGANKAENAEIRSGQMVSNYRPYAATYTAERKLNPYEITKIGFDPKGTIDKKTVSVEDLVVLQIEGSSQHNFEAFYLPKGQRPINPEAFGVRYRSTNQVSHFRKLQTVPQAQRNLKRFQTLEPLNMFKEGSNALQASVNSSSARLEQQAVSQRSFLTAATKLFSKFKR